MARILILGGGFGGVATALGLLPGLAEGHRVTLVERKSRFAMGLAKLWQLVGERAPDKGRGEVRALASKGIDVREAEVTAIDLERKTVTTSGGSLGYDVLVVALGAEAPADGVPGLRPEQNLYDFAAIPALRDWLAAIERGRVAIVVCGAPYKCPPAPFEAAMLIHTLLARRGVRGTVPIEVAIPDAAPMPVAGPAAGKAVRALLEERGIALRTQAKPVSVEGADGARGTVVFASGERLAADVLLAVPPHRPPAVVREAGLVDASGWIGVDPKTLATSRPDVFAVGDVASVKLPHSGMLPKAGIMAERQGEVVARNILARLRGHAPEASFDGNGYCFLEVGDRRAMAVEGAFFNEPEKRVAPVEPTAEGFVRKQAFERDRLARWFGA